MNEHRAGAMKTDPFSCTLFDAALCFASLVISTRYVMALAQLGQDAMLGVRPNGDAVFWVGLLGAPLAAMAPAWLLGRFTPMNPIWPAIGLATPLLIWTIGLITEPAALLLIGLASISAACWTIFPARHGRSLRLRSIHRRGLCPECGYSLKGLAGGVCPECGQRG
jgi:hypothetical protein